MPGESASDYGRRLITDTPALIGPHSPEPQWRYAGNELACSNCHLAGGTRADGLPLYRAEARYPRYFPRSGRVADLKERVNGCMTRSLNGRPLLEDGPEMQAIVAYLDLLGSTAPAKTAPSVRLALLSRAADPARGATVYQGTCASCHGAEGAGLATPGSSPYLFPPLWGDRSFNDGAGMARLITAANFIHDNMPANLASAAHPVLTGDDAWDVAAFVLSHPRPHMPGLENDYPRQSEKPIDSPYGPYADKFLVGQHRLGPYGPIEAAQQTETLPGAGGSLRPTAPH